MAVENNPYTPELIRNGTVFGLVECIAEYADIDNYIRYLVEEAQTDNAALELLAELLPETNPVLGYSLTTTQAVTLVQGGVKVNALPEYAEFTINHRIAEHR